MTTYTYILARSLDGGPSRSYLVSDRAECSHAHSGGVTGTYMAEVWTTHKPDATRYDLATARTLAERVGAAVVECTTPAHDARKLAQAECEHAERALRAAQNVLHNAQRKLSAANVAFRDARIARYGSDPTQWGSDV